MQKELSESYGLTYSFLLVIHHFELQSVQANSQSLL